MRPDLGTAINADCDCTPAEVARVITAGRTTRARNPRHTTRNRKAA